MNFNHVNANLRSEYCIVCNDESFGDWCLNCASCPNRHDIRIVAGLKIFSFIILQAWRKRRNELKQLKQSMEDIKKSCMRRENQLRVYSTLMRVEQNRNDELTVQLKRTLDNLKSKTAFCESTSMKLSNFKVNKAILEQELKTRYEEYDALHEVLVQTKTQLFRSMMEQRNLQSELCKEQRSVQSLQCHKNMLLKQICELNTEHRKVEEHFVKQLKDKDCEVIEAKQLVRKSQEPLIGVPKSFNYLINPKKVSDNIDKNLRLEQQEHPNSPLSRRLGMYLSRFLEYPKYTLHRVHTLTYYLLPAMPQPLPKTTTVPDSQAALRALSSYEVRSGVVMDCWTSLNELGAYNELTLCWVPGHEGHAGNERADCLANKGDRRSFIGPERIRSWVE
ncbi:uncharacterized protein LOC135950520 [Calliphora vicina]|uniref:uncharacterized protein LOC135950520 n=1 Tax=Calliphora vicina TaxID=7373 RepID=UPI00325AE717